MESFKQITAKTKLPIDVIKNEGDRCLVLTLTDHNYVLVGDTKIYFTSIVRTGGNGRAIRLMFVGPGGGRILRFTRDGKMENGPKKLPAKT